jgi:hypothetical protein
MIALTNLTHTRIVPNPSIRVDEDGDWRGSRGD